MSSPAPTTHLDGKVALLTASSRGMGRQNALEMASRGADIAANYSSSAPAADVVVDSIEKLGRQAIAIQADISQSGAIANLFEKVYEHFNRINIIVSNIRVKSFGHSSKITP